jgi:hypothetical protein
MERTQAYWENRPEVFQMLYEDFINEYEECMKIAKEKEAKGHLDPYNPNYVPMTEEEEKLHESDWRAFSRQRGYSEYDIAEYARWLKLSGQADNLEYAINDPWRRMYPNWGEQLYIKHIEIAISLGIEISPEVKASYEMVKKELERPIRVIGRSASHFDEITDGDTPKKR